VSDQVAYLDDLLLEDCLDEVFHGGPSPELAQRILTAASTVREASEAQDPTPAPSSVEGPLTALRTVPLDPDAPLSLPRWAIWLAQGAVAAGLVILLAVLVFPRDAEVPSGVIATEDAEFEYDTAVEWPEIQADAGWYLLSDGAPPLTAADSRVEDVKGQVIVKVGDIPNPDEQAAKQPWLDQHQVEAQMNGNWIKVGALSLLIVSGSAFVDGQYLSAQDVKKERKEAEVRKERKEAENADDVKKADRVADELAKLREEIADLEARLAEARELENERERTARVERIENALKDKRERIAEIEDKAAGERKERDDDAAAKKRREAERRKNAENDDDAAAKERREAERRKKAEDDDDAATKERREAERRKNAENDDDRKKREEEETRKKRDAERREKERKEGRKQ
jgi:hypothetical protein